MEQTFHYNQRPKHQTFSEQETVRPIPCPTFRGGEQHKLSFKSYVMTRSWGYGRGSQESWAFISVARGDADFPDITTLAELRAYLRRRELPPQLITAAERVWRSYQSQRERSLKR